MLAVSAVQASEVDIKPGKPVRVTPLVSQGVDEQAQLLYWQWQHQGLSLRLVQRLPDQTRGFFAARGFSKTAVDRIANACVFQTVMRNQSKQAVSYTLSEWWLTHDGKTTQIPSQAFWSKQWQALNESTAAKIAYRWAVVPAQQSLEVGDYFWGMSVYGLHPDQSFDLHFSYQIEGETFNGELLKVHCAADE